MLTTSEKKLSTLLIGVDTFYEGDIRSDDQADRNIADAWFSDEPLPEIYYDNFSKRARKFIKEKNGKNVLESKDDVDKYVEKYGLLDLNSDVSSDTTSTNNMINLSSALDVMLRTFLSKFGFCSPSFDERYIAATAGVVGNPNLYNLSESRDNLRKALSEVGYETSASRNLRENLLSWRNDKGLVSASELSSNVIKVRSELLQKMYDNVFNKLNFGGVLDNVSFDGHKFVTFNNEHYTGYSTYKGGPNLFGIFGYNTDHAPTLPELNHITSHEITGHYLNSALRDILYRNGRIEFLSTVTAMCTPMVVLQEGWAQNMFEIIYGSREKAAEVYGKDLLVALALSDLQDIAKHNVSILHQKYGKSIEDVKRYVADDCVQPDPIVDKMSRAWTTHEIIGPMYGPSYLVGKNIINDAIKKHGNLPVAEIGYHLKGYVDIGTFREKIDTL